MSGRPQQQVKIKQEVLIELRQKERINRHPLYAFVVTLVIFTIFVFIIDSWNSRNYNYTDTYVLPPDSPGKHVTNKNSLFWWTDLLKCLFDLLLVLSSFARILLPLSAWARLLHLISAVLCIIVRIMNMVAFGIEIPDCNTANFNMCNDPRFYCVYAPVITVLPTLVDIGYYPVLLADCAPIITAADLEWNSEFLCGFILSIIMLILGVLHFVLGYFFRLKTLESQPRMKNVENL